MMPLFHLGTLSGVGSNPVRHGRCFEATGNTAGSGVPAVIVRSTRIPRVAIPDIGHRLQVLVARHDRFGGQGLAVWAGIGSIFWL